MHMRVQEVLQRPLHSVADACAFYDAVDALPAQSGEAGASLMLLLPRVSHLYFARVDAGLQFAPYTLRAVPASRRPRNYYVVTRQHVVHACRATGTYRVVCTTQQWLRDAACFAQLRALPFFRDYVRRKALRVWLMRVRDVQWQRARAALLKQTVHTRAPLCEDVARAMQTLRTQLRDDDGSSTVMRFFVSDNKHATRTPRQDAGAAQLHAAQTAHYRAVCKVLARVVHTLRSLVAHRATATASALRASLRDGTTATRATAQKQALVAHTTHVPCLQRLLLYMVTHAVRELLRTQLTHLVHGVCNKGDASDEASVATATAVAETTVWRVYADCHVVYTMSNSSRSSNNSNGSTSSLPYEHGAQLSLQPSCEQLCDDVDALVTQTMTAVAHVVARVGEAVAVAPSPSSSYDCAAHTQRVLLDDAACVAARARLRARLRGDYARASDTMHATCGALLRAAALVARWDALRVRWTTSMLGSSGSGGDATMASAGAAAFVRGVADELRALAGDALPLQHALQQLAGERVCGTVVLRCAAAVAHARGEVDGALADARAVACSVADAAGEALREVQAEWLAQLHAPSLVADAAAGVLTRSEALVTWAECVRGASAACRALREREDGILLLRRVLCSVASNSSDNRNSVAVATVATTPPPSSSLCDALAASVLSAQQQCAAYTCEVRDGVTTRLASIARNVDEMHAQLTTRTARDAAVVMRDVAVRRMRAQLHRLQHEASALRRCAAALEVDVGQTLPDFDRVSALLPDGDDDGDKAAHDNVQ